MNHPMLHPAKTKGISATSTGDSIGTLLLQSGKITVENAEHVLRMQKEHGIRFGEAAKRLGLITDDDIQQVLARQFDYPYIRKGEAKFPSELKAAYEPFCAQVEVLRAVRSQLMLTWFARGQKSLVIMTVDAGDGASLFAANLAIVFSQLGEKTLLVDANLRTPRQHEIFDTQASHGLSDVLAGRAELASTINRVESFVALSVLGAGTLPPNPQELLSRSNFAAVNAQLQEDYDVVLYDVPALATAADAMAVASRAAGVLLVVRKNHTLVDNIQVLNDQVTQSGAHIVGSVLVDF